MRRIAAYIVIATSIFLGLGLNSMEVVRSTQGNLEFANGREFVYRLTDKENPEEIISAQAANDMAQTMISRLETSLVTKYEVEVEGNNQVRVTLSESTEIRYERLKQFLNFDGEFSICTTKDTCAVGEEMFTDSVARVDYKGQFPYVVIPLSDPTYFVDQIIQEAKDIQTENGGNPEDPADTLTEPAKILLWANKTEGDTYDASLENTAIAEKIILRFDYTQIWWTAESTEEISTLVSPAKYGQADTNNIFGSDAVRQANEEASHFVNLFNASPLSYDVEFLFEATIPASIENILFFGTHLTLAWSQTLLSTIIGGVILILVLIYFQRLHSIGIITSIIATLFTTALAFNLLGLEFSSATIIGALCILSLSLISALIYTRNFANEIYRGRQIKKAHAEAARRLTWPVIDLSVATFLFSLMTYLLGGNLVQNFSVFAMIGSVASLLFSLFLLKGMFWLVANESFVGKKLSLLGLDQKKVPDTLKEEKQNYFGRFAEVDFTKKKMTVGISSSLFALIGAALIVFLSVTTQPLVATPSSTIATRIYFEVTERSDIESAGWLEDNILTYLTVDGVAFDYENVTLHELTRVENEIDVLYRFYVVESSVSYSTSSLASYNDGAGFTISDSLDNVLFEAVYHIDQDEAVSSVSLHQVDGLSQQPSIGEIALGVLVGTLVALVYLSARYLISRAVAIFTTATLASILTLTFFLVTRIQTLTIVALAIIPTALLTIYLSIFVFDKEKELLSEISTLEPLEKRTTASIRSVGITFSTMLLISGILGYIALNFFGFGPQGMSPLFAGVTIAIALVTLFVTTLNTPISLFIFKFFNRLGLSNKVPRVRRHKRVIKEEVKTSEPQEATFIGIND